MLIYMSYRTGSSGFLPNGTFVLQCVSIFVSEFAPDVFTGRTRTDVKVATIKRKHREGQKRKEKWFLNNDDVTVLHTDEANFRRGKDVCPMFVTLNNPLWSNPNKQLKLLLMTGGGILK